MERRLLAFVTGLTVLAGSSLAAQEVRLTEDRANARFMLNGQEITIQRNQDTTHRLTGEYALTSRTCPAYCIQPIVAAPGVTTIAELETIGFLEEMVTAGDGLLIDSRPPARFAGGTIPGAVNIPHAAISPGNPYLSEIMIALGARSQGGGALAFDDAMELAIFCDGPWSGDAKQTIDNLLVAGYPASKIQYYRGGMQAWQSLGLSLSRQSNEG